MDDDNDGCVARGRVPHTEDEMAEQHRRQDEDRGLTAYGITLKPRTPRALRACRRFLSLRSHDSIHAIYRLGDDDLYLAAMAILDAAICRDEAADQFTDITMITPPIGPLCHRVFLGTCTERGRMKATVLCKTCGEVRTRLCLHHFNDLMKFLPESQAFCADRTAGSHSLVKLVEAAYDIT